MSRLVEQFEETIGKINGAYRGKYLLGLDIIEIPPNANKEGSSTDLEADLDSWRSQGGTGIIFYNKTTNFRTGILCLNTIPRGTLFVVADDEDYQKISREVENTRVGTIVSGRI